MDPSVRENSTRSDSFTFEAHDAWYKAKLASPANRIWVMEVEGIRVGQVRYGKVIGDYGAMDQAEIAIAVSPIHREKGYALELLNTTEPWAREWLGVSRLVALVLVGNYPSQKLFEKAGYTCVGWEERLRKMHRRYIK